MEESTSIENNARLTDGTFDESNEAFRPTLHHSPIYGPLSGHLIIIMCFVKILQGKAEQGRISQKRLTK